MALLALGAALPAWSVAGASRAATGSPTLDRQDCPVMGLDPDSVTFSGPASTLWPPNHKLFDYAVTASETPGESGNSVSLMVAVTMIDTANGAGNPATPDWTLAGKPESPMTTANGTDHVTVPLQLRAERAGTGIGRTYRIDWMATFDNGLHKCSSTDMMNSSNGTQHHAFVVTVPHDQGS